MLVETCVRFCGAGLRELLVAGGEGPHVGDALGILVDEALNCGDTISVHGHQTLDSGGALEGQSVQMRFQSVILTGQS